jgi:hypothetical protein
MARRTRSTRPTPKVSEAVRVMRRQNWEAKRAAMAEGRRERAATYTDRKREANKRACRSNAGW